MSLGAPSDWKNAWRSGSGVADHARRPSPHRRRVSARSAPCRATRSRGGCSPTAVGGERSDEVGARGDRAEHVAGTPVVADEIDRLPRPADPFQLADQPRAVGDATSPAQPSGVGAPNPGGDSSTMSSMPRSRSSSTSSVQIASTSGLPWTKTFVVMPVVCSTIERAVRVVVPPGRRAAADDQAYGAR